MVWLETSAREWADALVPLLVQNTVFLGLVFLLLYLLRRESAALRYIVAAVALVKLILPPFLPFNLLWPGGSPDESGQISTLLFSFAGSEPAAEAAGEASGGAGLPGLILGVWLVAAGTRLICSLHGTAALAYSVRRALPVTDDPALDVLVGRGVQVLRTGHIALPLSLGVFPRRIYVPEAYTDWPEAHRRSVLRHELAHLRRADGVFQFLEAVVQALYFFHPLALLLIRRLREYREMACDDASSGPGDRDRLGYSRFLVALAETTLRHPPVAESAATLFRRQNELMKRVTYQLREGKMNGFSGRRLAVVVAVLVAAMLPLSMYQADAGTTGKKEKKGEKEVQSKAVHHVTISLKGDVLLVDGEETGLQELTDTLAKTRQMYGPDTVVKLACAADVKMATLAKVQTRLQKLDMVKVVYTDGQGRKLKMMLPTKGMEKKLDGLPADQVVHLKIDPKDRLFLKGQEIPAAKASKIIAGLLKKTPELVVAIHPAGPASYGVFLETLTLVKKAGVGRIFIDQPA